MADPITTPGVAPLPPDPKDEKYGRFDIRRITGTAPMLPLLVLFGLNAVDELDRSGFNVLLPNIKESFGLSLTGVSALITVMALVGLLVELPVGYYADRKSRVRIAMLGAGAWAFFSGLTGFSGITLSLGLLYVARAGSVLGKTANATHLSLLSDYYPVDSRVRVIYAHRAANSVGQFVGPITAGFLAAWLGWQYPFFLFIIPTVVFIVLAFKLKEPKRGMHERMAAGADEETASIEEDPPGFGETFRVLFNNRSARSIYFSLPFLSASAIGLSNFISLFYEEVFGINETRRGLIFGFVEPVQLVGLLIGATVVQRIVLKDPGRAMRLLGVSAIGQAGFLCIFALAPNVGVAIGAQFARAFVDGMLFPGILAVISLAVPARMRALGFATGNLWLLMGLPVNLVVGGIGDAFGIRFGILIFVPVYLVGSLLLASAGLFINNDIEKLNTSARTQAEAKRRRDEGDSQMMIIRGLDAGYDGTQILFNVDFEVEDGEIIALLGTNGAGKSTLLKAISGIIQPTAGAIIFDGRDITGADSIQTAHLGVAQVPGGRGVFPTLTVGENIRAAGWMYRKDKEYLEEATKNVLEYFPALEKRWDTAAGSLSGGEQQMLSLAQAFIARPKLLMIDELSLGLAPTIVERLLEIVEAIHANGTTIIIVEQSVNVALRLAKRAVFMEKGEIRFSGPTAELLGRADILRAVFLKGADAGAKELEAGNGKPVSARAAKAALAADLERRAELLERPVVLEARSLVKRYGGVTAVNDVSFELHKGQILGLIGPNGAGKTTIFDLLSGFASIDGGTILLDGRDITDWPAHRRAAAGLGRSFQDARLWPSLTVRESLAAAMAQSVEMGSPLAAAVGLPAVADSEAVLMERVEELIELIGLGAFRDKFISELSTGSRRMVEIATLVANEPSVIILDEPSSGIAQKETEALGPMLREVQRYTDSSILVIEHDMPLLSGLADHVVALELGTVIAFGTPEEVLNHPRVVESYLGNASYPELGIGGSDAAPAPSNGAGSANGQGTRRRRRTRTST